MKLRHFTTLLTLVAGLFVLTGCETQPPSSRDSEWKRPPRYGSGGSNNSYSSSRNGDSNRFGYSGNERSRPDTSSNSSGDRDRNRNNNDDEVVINDKPEKEESTSSGSGDLGYAIGVPGKPLSVTLPGSAKSLGPISIEKYDAAGNPTGEPLPRGTPVEIPDPNNPGKKIQFKVP